MTATAGLPVTVNGKPRRLPQGSTVSDVIAALGGDPDARGVAAAVNGTVVPRSRWATQELNQQDRVEILTAVQGG